MTRSIWLKATATWTAILVLAILNGTLRVKLLVPALGGTTGLVASGLILSTCVLVVAYAAAPWYGSLTSRQWLGMGLLWLLLTLTFEFSIGSLLQHKSWDELLAAYTFRGGNLWSLVLLVIVISPWLAAKVRRLV